MKRIAVLITLCIPLLLHAQSSKWQVCPSMGIDMGFTIPFPFSDIPDGAKVTPRLNPNLGGGVIYQFSGKWGIGFEAIYHTLAFSARADVRSQPFFFDNHVDVLYFSGETSTKIRLQYIEFPLMALYTINPKWIFLPGIYYSRILDGYFRTKGMNGILSDDRTITDNAPLPGVANTHYDFNEFIDVWDAGLFIGFQYRMKQRFFIWSRLRVGFKSLFVKEFTNIEYEMYQVDLNVGVSVPFSIGKK
jgi:hypothetical protein